MQKAVTKYLNGVLVSEQAVPLRQAGATWVV